MNNQDSFKHISAEEFSKLEYDKYTLIDLREPDEVLVSGIEEAINMPFSEGFGRLDSIPADKPVVVFCRMGSWSEEVAEILSDRGYDAYSLDGGYSAFRALKEDNVPTEGVDAKEISCAADAKEISCTADAKEISTPVRMSRDTPVLIDAEQMSRTYSEGGGLSSSEINAIGEEWWLKRQRMLLRRI